MCFYNKLFYKIFFGFLTAFSVAVAAAHDTVISETGAYSDTAYAAFSHALGSLEHLLFAIACGLVALAYQHRLAVICALNAVLAGGGLANTLPVSEFVAVAGLAGVCLLIRPGFQGKTDLLLIITLVFAFVGLFFGYMHGAGVQNWTMSLVIAYLFGLWLVQSLLAVMIMVFARLIGQMISMAAGARVKS